jgi:fibronectin-binding autotransporter adhesin
MLVNGSTLEGQVLGLSKDSSLQGTGTIIVNERFTAEGQIKPGNSPGVLRIGGNVALTDSSELVLEVAGMAAGTQHDVLQVLGSPTLQGGRVSLSFIDGFAPLQGQQFVLFDVGGSFQSTAAFAVTGLEEGWQFSTGFDPVTGESTLTSLSSGVSAVPEPATWLLWGAGFGLWLLRRRRA